METTEMGVKKIAIACGGRWGTGLAAYMNRKLPGGEMRFGITVLRPDDPMTGRRWDVILMMPLPHEASDTERERYMRWCSEQLPTKLVFGGEIIPMFETQFPEGLT